MLQTKITLFRASASACPYGHCCTSWVSSGHTFCHYPAGVSGICEPWGGRTPSKSPGPLTLCCSQCLGREHGKDMLVPPAVWACTCWLQPQQSWRAQPSFSTRILCIGSAGWEKYSLNTRSHSSSCGLKPWDGGARSSLINIVSMSNVTILNFFWKLWVFEWVYSCILHTGDVNYFSQLL